MKPTLLAAMMLAGFSSSVLADESWRLSCGGTLGTVEYDDAGKDVTSINPKGETFYNRIKTVTHRDRKTFIVARGGNGEYDMHIVFDPRSGSAKATAWQNGHQIGYDIDCSRE